MTGRGFSVCVCMRVSFMKERWDYLDKERGQVNVKRVSQGILIGSVNVFQEWDEFWISSFCKYNEHMAMKIQK